MGNIPVVQNVNLPIRLRGHTLLCLQGFRGLGYSPEFTANLARISKDLAGNLEATVEVLDTPDAVCGACPHEAGSAGCTLNGPQSEVTIRDQDGAVLTLLGLHPGEKTTWATILDRIRTSISGDDLPKICGGCRWLSLGFCSSGIEQLRGSR